MSAYDDLVEKIADSIDGTHLPENAARHKARAILAEVLHTLEAVTPEMLLQRPAWNGDTHGEQARDTFVAMLRSSPLTPPFTTS